jgi:hypothetical protein
MGMSNAAASIRTDLKAAGYALRAFSIRSARTGSVTVEIKDASIRKSAITELASRHEKIDRDAASGEILSGGNTFVSVSYARNALEAAGAALTKRLHLGQRLFASLQVDSQSADCSHTWHVWSTGAGGRHLRQISPFGGEALAELLAERGELAAALQAPAPELDESRELAARLEHIANARELLLRAVSELGATVATVAAADAAMSEAEALITRARVEFDC